MEERERCVDLWLHTGKHWALQKLPHYLFILFKRFNMNCTEWWAMNSCRTSRLIRALMETHTLSHVWVFLLRRLKEKGHRDHEDLRWLTLMHHTSQQTCWSWMLWKIRWAPLSNPHNPCVMTHCSDSSDKNKVSWLVRLLGIFRYGS